MKDRRSFSCGCAKIHELPISVFLLSFSVSPLSVSPVFPVSLSLALSPWSLASLPRLSSRVVCRRVVRSLASSRRLSSRVVCRLVVRRPAARCQSRRVLGVSRVLRSHRVVRSLASSHRLSSRVVCRLAVRRPGLPVRRPSCSMSVASCAESFQSRLVVRRPAGRCQSRRVLSPATLSC